MNRIFFSQYLLIGILSCVGYSYSKSKLWVPVYIEPQDIEKADSLETAIKAHADMSTPKKETWLTIKRGSKPIIITAPHASQTMRNGSMRFSDKGTGSLAEMLYQIAGVTVLYTNWPSPCDANNTDQCAFKDSLLALIREIKPVLVLDLHSSNPERPYDIDFGTMNGKSIQLNSQLLLGLAQVLAANGLINQSLDFFKADQNQTITKFVRQNKVEAIQLEINAIWLKPDGDSMDRHRYSQLLNGLVQFLRSRP